MNTVMIALNVAVFFITFLAPSLLLPSAESPRQVIESLGLVPNRALRGEALYALLTSVFLHASLFHLVGNMIFLYVFGGEVEVTMGKTKYLAIYLISGIAASVAHVMSTIVSGGSDVPAIGSSGAVSGIMGAYLMLFHLGRIGTVRTMTLSPAYLGVPVVVYVIFWFLYQLLFGIADIFGELYVAFWAHIAGFLVGAAIAYLMERRPYRR